MASQGSYCLPKLDCPHPDRSITTSGESRVSVRTKYRRIDSASVSVKGLQFKARVCVPDPCCAILACCKNPFAFTIKLCGIYGSGVAAQFCAWFTGCHVPNLGSFV